MRSAVGEQTKIDGYLTRLRSALRGLPEAEIEDILRELHSHATDLSEKEGQGIDAALASLGDPVELAATYRAENRMIRAECSGSPLVIPQGLRHASRSSLGRITVTSLYFFGYINLFVLWSAALEKLFAPTRAGLWYLPGHFWSVTLVAFDYPPPGARELLGWWLVPITGLTGWGVKYLSDRLARSWIARFRRRNELKEV